MHSFLAGSIGGIIIGLGAAVLLLFNGDIMGASGLINSSVLHPLKTLTDPSCHWKLVLLAAFSLTAHLFFESIYQDKNQALAQISPAAFVIGGFFVGFGTKLGNGCTSGHGICGMARFSKRSIIAVGTFMVVAIVTAVLTQEATAPGQYSDFLRNSEPITPIESYTRIAALWVFALCLLAFAAPTFAKASAAVQPSSSAEATTVTTASVRKLAPAAVAGVLFSLGLYVSEMVYPTRVLGFLNLGLLAQGDWDATLLFVMGFGCVVSMISYQFVPGHNYIAELTSSTWPTPWSKPLCQPQGCCGFKGVPTNTIIDSDLLLGASCFGIGWGISGLCPGPAMVLASIGISWVLFCYWPAFFVGAFLAEYYKNSRGARDNSNACCQPCEPCHHGDASKQDSNQLLQLPAATTDFHMHDEGTDPEKSLGGSSA